MDHPQLAWLSHNFLSRSLGLNSPHSSCCSRNKARERKKEGKKEKGKKERKKEKERKREKERKKQARAKKFDLLAL